MARRTLTPEEEERLIAEAERARDDPDADLGQPFKVYRGENPVVPIEIELPLEQYRRLREEAGRRGMMVTQFVTEAVAAMADGLADTAPAAQPRRKASA